MTPRLLPCGEGAVLVELDDLDTVLAFAAAARAAVQRREPGFVDVVDVVPAARTVLVGLGDGADLSELRAALRRLDVTASTEPERDSGEPVEIPVRYDGPDLGWLADHLGSTPAEVVARHTGVVWRVAFGGFAPGFAYLTGGAGDPVPRRTEPRDRIPAGAVALADIFSAVYPRSSPGGWQIIGRTDLPVWDLDRDPPAVLVPGAVVRFVDVGSG